MCAAPRRNPRSTADSARKGEPGRALASALLRIAARRVGGGRRRLLRDEGSRGPAHAAATDGGQERDRRERRNDAQHRDGGRARPRNRLHATVGGVASRIGRTRERRRAACRVDHEPVMRAIRSRHGCTVPRIALRRLAGDRGEGSWRTIRTGDLGKQTGQAIGAGDPGKRSTRTRIGGRSDGRSMGGTAARSVEVAGLL